MADIIFIGLGIGMIGLGIVGTLWFGVKSIINGKTDLKRALIMLVPFVIFGIAFVTTGSAAQAAIATMIVMAAAMILAIAFTGLKGTFKI